MQKFELPENNVFEEQARLFFKRKRAKELQQKYQVKPFDERFSVLYYCSIVVSYFANILSALTASTWVFTYLYSIIKDLPYPSIHAGFWTVLLLLLLELLQRFLAIDFFKTRLQFGYTSHTKRTLNVLVVCMLVLSVISITFSSLGGFDLVDLVLSKPTYERPELENKKEVEQRYTQLVYQAKAEAEDYKDRKLYRGRLSDKHAAHYRHLLGRKNRLEDSLLVALHRVDSENKGRMRISQAEFTEALSLHENQINSRGIGLGGVTVFFIGLFFVCIWFREYYDYRTALLYSHNFLSPTLFEEKEEERVRAIEEDQAVDLLKQLESLRSKIAQLEEEKPSGLTDLTQVKVRPENGSSSSDLPKRSLPIGFFSESEREVQQKHLFKQPQEPFKQTLLEKGECYEDRYTIAHTDLRTGKIKHLALDSINNRISIYKLRMASAVLSKDASLIARRKNRLLYWESRRVELLEKLGTKK